MSVAAEEVEKFLEHHGVRGQRWGVRNTASGRIGTPTAGTSSAAKSKPADSSSGGSGVSKGVKSKTAHLSNDELKKVVERMRLDQQYNELANPKKEGGKQYVGKLLKDSGNKIIGAVVTTAATLAVTYALGKYVAKGEAQKELAKESFKTAAKTAAAAKAAFPPPTINLRP